MAKQKKSGRAQYHAPTPSVAESPTPQVQPKTPRPDPWSGESRGAVFLTVGWMFSMLATLLSLFLWLGVWWYIANGVSDFSAGTREAKQFHEWANMIWTYATLFALATGLITLVIGVIVNRIRNKPAPPSVRRLGGIVGALPWAIYVTMFLMSR